MRQDAIAERVPPQSLEAEVSVLGSMLLDREAMGRAFELLDGPTFYRRGHRLIYEAMQALYERNEAVDLVTVSEELRKNNSLDDAGGSAYLASLVDSVPSAANVEAYAKIAKEKSLLRELIRTGNQIVAESYENPAEVDTFLDHVEQMVFQISEGKQQRDYVSVKDIIHDSLETAEELSQRKQRVTGVATGFYEFDTMTSGLQPSELVIIAGRPSMGKSSLATNILLHVALELKLPVVVFSIEMSKDQLVQRMLCSAARVDAHKLRTGYLSESAFPRLATAAGRLAEASIFIDDTPSISTLELRSKARRLRAREGIELVVIDYLQMMQSSKRSDSRQQEISEISRSLKALARELEVPVVALSQLSRAVESRQDHRPQLSDLRESGAIEQDADLVALMLREEYYEATTENRGLAQIEIAKQRNGPVGTFQLAFLQQYTLFENLSRRSEA